MPKNLTYVNADSIDFITISKPRLTDFAWYEGEPPKYILFGLIRIKQGIKTGWCNYGGTMYRRHTTEALLKDDYIFEKDNVNGKQWLKKPYMLIRMGRNSLGEYFDTLDEAINVANEISDKAKSNFQILIN